MSGSVLQSGVVTPGHLAVWDGNGIMIDGGPVPSAGGPFLPLAGGMMLGPLILAADPVVALGAATKNYVDTHGGGGGLTWTSTGATTPIAAPDRSAQYYSALDFGVICDGVTDQGAQLNAAIAAIPAGRTLYIPGSVYTTQTIVVQGGRRLEMPPGTLVRPVPNDHATWLPTFAIIGSASLSPVVLVFGGPGGGITNAQITRNGTPGAGTIGLQSIGQNQTYAHVYSWNHAIGLQCGAPLASPVMGQSVAITCAFDHCVIWACSEHYAYLINAPEMSFYDQRFGINGNAVVLPGLISIVTVDGDNNATAGGPNTLTFLRCQFNVGDSPQYSVQFTKMLFQGVFKFIGCYSGGAVTAFCYINPDCTFVQGITFMGCTFQPIHVGETFFLDSAAKSNGTKIIGCEFSNDLVGGFTLSGIGVTIIGNTWFGGSGIQLDSMTGGCLIGNSGNTFTLTGAFTGHFTVSGNFYGAFHNSATGPVIVGSQNQTTVGGALSFLNEVDNTLIQLAAPSAAGADFIHLLSRDPIDTGIGAKAIFDTPFLIGHSGGLTALPGGQGAAPQIVSQISYIAVCGNTGNGVLLPVANAGYWQVVTNTAGLNATVFATGSDTINTVAGSTGYTLLPGKTLTLYCYVAGAWFGGVLS